jgi:DNA-binding MarR family transcriptional regulator
MNTAEYARDSLGDTVHLIILGIHKLSSAYRKRSQVWTRNCGLTPPQWRLMSVAAGEHRSVPQLARRMLLARQTVQRTADQLVTKGLAYFHPNPDHQRSPYLVIFDEGLEILSRMENQMREQRQRFIEQNGLLHKDLEVMLSVLESMQQFIDSSPPWR